MVSAAPPRVVPAELTGALALYRDKLRGAFGARFVGLRLYGSWARSEQGPDSDIDVAVFIEGLTSAELRLAVFLAADTMGETNLPISAQPYDPIRYRAMVSRAQPFFSAMEREGIPL